jgi:hypothetical protein
VGSILPIAIDEFGWGRAIPWEDELRKKRLHTEKNTIPKMSQPAVCCFSDKDPLAKPSKNTKLTITRIETSIAAGSGVSIKYRRAAICHTFLQIHSTWKILKKA